MGPPAASVGEAVRRLNPLYAWSRLPADHSRRVERLLRQLGVPACALAELHRRHGRRGSPGAADRFVFWLQLLQDADRGHPLSLPVWSAAGYRLVAEDHLMGAQIRALVAAWDDQPLGWLAVAAGLRPGEVAEVATEADLLAFLAALRGHAWVAPFLGAVRGAGYRLDGPPCGDPGADRPPEVTP